MGVRRLCHNQHDHVSHILWLSQLRQIVLVVIASHLCVYGSRFDQGGFHSMGKTLVVGHPSESAHAKLGSTVSAIPGTRVPTGERGDVEDMPMSLLAHVTKNGLRAEKDPFQINGDVEVPEFLGYLRDG